MILYPHPFEIVVGIGVVLGVFGIPALFVLLTIGKLLSLCFRR